MNFNTEDKYILLNGLDSLIKKSSFLMKEHEEKKIKYYNYRKKLFKLELDIENNTITNLDPTILFTLKLNLENI